LKNVKKNNWAVWKPYQEVDMEWIHKIKVGDTVHRYLSSVEIPMDLKVTEITDEKIICGAWEFSKETGGEIDDYLGWGPYLTGSILKKE
jgi:hypothetical protein